jgi:hypothetical protein
MAMLKGQFGTTTNADTIAQVKRLQLSYNEKFAALGPQFAVQALVSEAINILARAYRRELSPEELDRVRIRMTVAGNNHPAEVVRQYALKEEGVYAYFCVILALSGILLDFATPRSDIEDWRRDRQIVEGSDGFADPIYSACVRMRNAGVSAGGVFAAAIINAAGFALAEGVDTATMLEHLTRTTEFALTRGESMKAWRRSHGIRFD